MTNLAQYLYDFLWEYLPVERRASPHTCEAYAHTFQLLVGFAAWKLKCIPSKITIEQLHIDFILLFLKHLEETRNNTVRTRNTRLAAIKTFFKYLEYRSVVFVEQSRRIQTIPCKAVDERLVDHLTPEEMQTILDCPVRNTVTGIRDSAMLFLCYSAGLRVSELIDLRVDQLDLGSLPTVHVIGKGRKERILPIWKETVTALNTWIAVRSSSATVSHLFLNSRGEAITRSGFRYILNKYVDVATKDMPSLAKKRITPHVLRHSCAMMTLRATHDIRKVSLWLGHADIKSTEIYLRSDPYEKLETLLSIAPPSLQPGKFKAPDKLIAMLRSVSAG